MAFVKSKMEMSSPTEDIFSWVTPNSDVKKLDLPQKRKCASDSGYMSGSVSPASECRNLTRKPLFQTPEILNRNGFGLSEDGMYTPSVKFSGEYLKKRLLQCSQEGKSLSLVNTPTIVEMDSFSDFMMDASLYNEPMDISVVEPSSQDIITEENLDISELGQKCTIDISMEINSFHSEPITPLKSAKYVDRLFKSSYTSPRKKRISKIRSLDGFEKVDIIFQLGEKANFSLPIRRILDYLEDSDLATVTMVSKSWKNICLSYPKAKDRWMKYTADRRERKENLCSSHSVSKKKSTYPLLNHNHSTPLQTRQPRSPPVSPSKLRFHLFQKEAQRLKEDEKLMACPRCSLPSTISPANRLGRCTRAGCGLEFCGSCRSPYHGARPCTTSTPTSPPRRTKRIGSKESKRFLRRL